MKPSIANMWRPWCAIVVLGLAGCARSGCADAEGPSTTGVAVAPIVPPVAVAPAAAPEADAGFEETVVVLSTTGKAEVRRGAQQVGWVALQEGERLRENDAVRTLEDGTLELKVSDIRVAVEERSQLEVKRITQAVFRARFSGRIASKVGRGSAALELETPDSGAVVRTDEGAFSITADGNGVVAVATVSGKVDFSARGRTVTVGAGEISRAIDKGGPEAPRPGLQDVLLSVVWPARKETRFSVVQISGKVTPGSRVKVQNTLASVRRDGRFTARVRLRQGTQKIAVVATDVAGQTRRVEAELFHDGRAPEVDLTRRPWQ